MYYLIHDPTDDEDAYFYYNATTDMWSSWQRTIARALSAKKAVLDLDEDIVKACADNDFLILLTSKKPININDHPELLL